MSNSEWYPHAEKAFGHFNYTVGKYLPRALTRVIRAGTQIRALPATTQKKAK